MADKARRQDWTVLGLRPGAGPDEVQKAYDRRRALYEKETLATYSLLSDKERSTMLSRLDLAFERIMGQPPTPLKPSRPPQEPEPSLPFPQGEAKEEAPSPDPEPETETAHAAEPEEPTEADEPTRDAPPGLPSEPPPDPAGAPGAFLRFHRLRRGIELADIAGETKIRAAQIEKLESEDFAALPAAVYVRGFILQYARLLGLQNPDDIASQYLARLRSNLPSD